MISFGNILSCLGLIRYQRGDLVVLRVEDYEPVGDIFGTHQSCGTVNTYGVVVEVKDKWEWDGGDLIWSFYDSGQKIGVSSKSLELRRANLLERLLRQFTSIE